jgi:zinc protease
MLQRTFRPRLAWLLSCTFLALLAPLPAPAAEDDSGLALRTATALYAGIRTAELPNGLRIYLKPIPGATAVTTMVVYKVGSADEDKEWTGLSHYLEHLMFKGTATLKPGDIDRISFRNGGSNNAFTNTDLTAYHFTFPAGRWLAALEVEADRMRNLRIDKEHEFDKEKGAVISELDGGEDSPWDLEGKAILPLLFGKMAPYGHPIIGEAKHVRDATPAVIKAHYDKWYHPNNAALIMVGGFDADQALVAIKKLFGPIPRAKLPPRKAVPRAEAKRPARLEMESKFSVARLLIGYNTVRSSDADYAALNVLEALLSRGKTSRLYKNLVEGAEIASAIGADHTAGRYPGWFGVQVELLPGKDRAEAEKLALKELARLRDEKVSAAELKRVKHLILAKQVFDRESVSGLCTSIAEAVTTNDLDFARKYLPRVLAVSADDVQRVARKYLAPEQRVTVWSVPAKGAKAASSRAPAARQSAARQSGGTPPPNPLPEAERGSKRALRLPSPLRGGAGGGVSARRDKAAPAGFSLAKTQRLVLPNGLVLLLFENRRLPIVEAYVNFNDVDLYEPADKIGLASLMGSLLDEGTRKHSGTAIAELIGNVGGTLSLTSSGGSVQVLAPDRKLGLQLLLECLTQPSFPKAAFARNRTRQLAEIAEAETQASSRARQAFRAAVYGPHPFGRPSLGTVKSVSALTVADCAAFHKQVFVPNNATMVIVGDFDAKEVADEVKQLTADWKKAPLERPKLPPLEKPKAFTQTVLTMPEAAQAYVYLGHVGVRRDNPDYYKLLVMDYVLGTGPGFTDRLSARLRDREGLAYSVSASISGSAGTEPGTFTGYVGTKAENFAKAKGLFLEELNRIRDEAPTAREVGDAKTYLIGSRLLDLSTNSGIAAQLLTIERYKLGLNYLDDFSKAVAAVTPADVQAVARKYLSPKQMVLVVAGAIDKDGKPLAKAAAPKE